MSHEARSEEGLPVNEAPLPTCDAVPNSARDHNNRNALFIGGYAMHSLPAEWLPASVAPTDRDLEVCILGYDGIVHALVAPCHKDGAAWVDTSGQMRADLEPTHWRKWTEGH
jgi:hypothetical protein